MADTLYPYAADALLFAHATFVLFIIVGLVCIIVGKRRAWSWVRNPWFRAGHLAGIVLVMLQSWAGRICPLTRWEMALRENAEAGVYTGSFIAHWVESILYYRAPAWVFIVLYTLFAAAVVATWVWVRPDAFFSKSARGDNQGLKCTGKITARIYRKK